MRRLLFVIALSGACGSAQKNQETLTDAIRAYNDGLRWNRFEVAASQVPPKERAEFVDEMDERADTLKMTDYEVVKVDSKGEKEARVQVKVSWYLDNIGTLHETHAVQTWERHGKVWWMVDESRLRGDEMPGLSEPDDTATAPADPARPLPAPSVN
ncbi:MAG: hypothetical protein H0T42_00135 [Deltaproteobacteria bacterium]|nr:hypothetical protein [Deltaproteobacteria bacterium]